MSTRIFSCGKSLENFKICIAQRVIGFRFMFNENIQGDTVYLVLTKDKISHCYARATVSSMTENAPWEDSSVYVQCNKIQNIEFCTPFSLGFLKNTSAGKSWYLVFAQKSKAIKDDTAIKMLNEHFEQNISDKFYEPTEDEINPPPKKRGRKPKQNINTDLIPNDIDDVMGADDNSKFDIMCTLKTVKFKNEIDTVKGLEILVNENFYKLFVSIQEENSIFISDNRYFPTVGRDDTNGIGGRPDALLITFDNDDKKSKLKINIIEYECYGEGKTKATDKFNYMNAHIIPQLIRFASTFSIVTDSKIRDKTIESWVNKIIDYIKAKVKELEPKIFGWLKQSDKDIIQSFIIDTFRKELMIAFNNNIRIMLIIDELTGEQNDTIKNVIHSFKLFGNGKDDSCYIDFSGYVVRLEHMLNYDNTATSKYALSIQDN